MKLKKESKNELEVEGLIDEPRWYKIPCSCSTKKDDVENQFPIKSCFHCKFTVQEKSLQDVISKGQFKMGKVTIKKIKIHRGDRFQEVLGWFNISK